MIPFSLASSYHWHPDHWTARSDATNTCDRPAPGQIVAYRYATWRVIEVRPRADEDLTADDQERMSAWKPEFRDGARPYVLVLRHERGPILVKHTQRLHDGSVTVHFGVPAGRRRSWQILDDRYALCACCGHPYPCQEYANERIAEAESARMSRLLDSHAPGVCAACREPISTRQRVVTFPEPSLLVPGAPGPMFHAGRGDCWRKARSYERDSRLPAYPDAVRLASCPGLLFVHEADGREECTAQGLCTGFHGPKSSRERVHCATRTYVASNEGCYPRPPSDCGYRKHGSCLGSDHSLGAPDPFTAGDRLAQDRRGWV